MQGSHHLFGTLTGGLGVDLLYEGAERWDGVIQQDGNLGRTEVLAAGVLVQTFGETSVTLNLRVPMYRHIVTGDEPGGSLSSPVMLSVIVSRSFGGSPTDGRGQAAAARARARSGAAPRRRAAGPEGLVDVGARDRAQQERADRDGQDRDPRPDEQLARPPDRRRRVQAETDRLHRRRDLGVVGRCRQRALVEHADQPSVPLDEQDRDPLERRDLPRRGHRQMLGDRRHCPCPEIADRWCPLSVCAPIDVRCRL